MLTRLVKRGRQCLLAGEVNKATHLRWKIIRMKKIKMAIILPTGQWYAPSAVINDAWYCMVLHGIALYYIVLHGIA